MKPPSDPVEPPHVGHPLAGLDALSQIYRGRAGFRIALLPLGIFSDRPLVAVIPGGAEEGMIHFARPDEDNRTRGLWSAVRDPYRQIPVDATVLPDRITIRFPNRIRTARRRRRAHLELAANTAVICHRILGVSATTKNDIEAVAVARHWGCAGIEIDVAVVARGRGRNREPDVSRCWVEHPPTLRAELGLDWLRPRHVRHAATFESVLSAADEAGIRYVYVDPKLQWLDRDAKGQALRRIGQVAALHPSIAAVVAAPTHDVARAIVDQGLDAWLPESTKGTRDDQYVAYLTRNSGRPSALSFNLMRLRGSRKRLLPRLDADHERLFATSAYPIVLWTAAGPRSQRGAVTVLRRWRGHSGPEMPSMALMSGRPHATLWALASADLD